MALDVPESVAAHWYTAQKCLDPARHPSLAANLRHAIEAVAGARAARALVEGVDWIVRDGATNEPAQGRGLYAQWGASAWIAHSKLSKVWVLPPIRTSKDLS